MSNLVKKGLVGLLVAPIVVGFGVMVYNDSQKKPQEIMSVREVSQAELDAKKNPITPVPVEVKEPECDPSFTIKTQEPIIEKEVTLEQITLSPEEQESYMLIKNIPNSDPETPNQLLYNISIKPTEHFPFLKPVGKIKRKLENSLVSTQVDLVLENESDLEMLDEISYLKSVFDNSLLKRNRVLKVPLKLSLLTKQNSLRKTQANSILSCKDKLMYSIYSGSYNGRDIEVSMLYAEPKTSGHCSIKDLKTNTTISMCLDESFRKYGGFDKLKRGDDCIEFSYSGTKANFKAFANLINVDNFVVFNPCTYGYDQNSDLTLKSMSLPIVSNNDPFNSMLKGVVVILKEK